MVVIEYKNVNNTWCLPSSEGTESQQAVVVLRPRQRPKMLWQVTVEELRQKRVQREVS